jgi:hypothetical protein
MINLTTISNGFVMRELEYLFEGESEILDETQAHVPTDRGVIFCDTTMTIDNESFTNINDFLTKLYGK